MQSLPPLHEGWPQEDFPNRQWGITNTPFYTPIDERFILIGITHSDFVGSITANTFKTFSRTIKGLDNLIMEGDEQIHALNKAHKKNNYESKALREFTGRPIFIDDGQNYLPALASQNVAEIWVATYKLIKSMPALTEDTPTFATFKSRLAMFAPFYKSATLKFTSIDKKCLEMIAFGLTVAISSHHPLRESANVHDIFRVAEVFHHHYGRTRDQARYGPEIMRYRTELKGATGALVGAAHLEYLTRALNEGQAPAILPWGSYLTTYFPQLLDAQSTIEEVVWRAEDHLGRPRSPTPVSKI